MGIDSRLRLYEELEGKRGRPLIVYVTSNRLNASGMMGGDAVPEMLAQLTALPPGTTKLDLLVASNGGDPTVAWRIACLLRETVTEFAVLVPQAAFSAATLMALGADEIVMHRHGNLGPVDPQITVQRISPKDGKQEQINFGSEDLSSFLEFARSKVGLTDQAQLLRVFELFCNEVGSVPIGIASRSSHLSVSMGEKLLRMHMKEGDSQQARTIAESLNKDFFHHGYPVGRTEAKEIGLKVTAPPPDVEDLLWKIWLDCEDELKIREPFSPLAEIRANPACAPLFAPVPMVNLPGNLPQPVLQQVYASVIQQVQVHQIPPTDYQLIQAMIESRRLASRFVTEGRILATRTPDMQLKVNVVPENSAWTTLPLASVAPAPVTGATP